MESSIEVRDAVLAFYEGVTTKAVDRFEEIVSADPATLVIGTAPGEWVTERPRLRFGFETEGITLERGPNPVGYLEGSMGWFVDEPWFGFPDGSGMRTRLTAVVCEEAGRWKVLHMHFSVGVPDEEVQDLQARWGVTQQQFAPTKYLLLFHDQWDPKPETMDAWQAWFARLGDRFIDSGTPLVTVSR